MKIFAFTDNHADIKCLEEIKRKVAREKPDLIICCGDISIFGKGLNFACSIINDLGIKTLIIPGNHETPNDIIKVCSRFKNLVDLHCKALSFNEFIFFGYGTGGFAAVDKNLEKIYPKFLKCLDRNKKLVFVTHAPIFNTRLDNLNDIHVGCKTSRNFIEKAKPVLVLCGHIHENEKKKDKIGNSMIINPGPDGMIIEL